MKVPNKSLHTNRRRGGSFPTRRFTRRQIRCWRPVPAAVGELCRSADPCILLIDAVRRRAHTSSAPVPEPSSRCEVTVMAPPNQSLLPTTVEHLAGDAERRAGRGRVLRYA